MYKFKLPDLGEGIHEGEILKWHVELGELAGEDEPLVEVETDKAAVTIPSPVAGTLRSRGGEVGEVVIVGSVIAEIEDGSPAVAETPTAAGSEADANAKRDPKRTTPAGKAAVAPVSAPREPASRNASGPLPAAPATRRLARELGVDLHQVQPTGPAGRITAEDVQRFAESSGSGTSVAAAGAPSQPPTPTQAEAAFAAHAASAIPFLDLEPLPDFSQFGKIDVEPLRSIRRRVAHKMTTSKILVPHVAHMDEADVTELEAFRKKERERRPEDQPGGRLTLLSFVVKAVTAGLRATPAFNASLDPFREQIIYKKYYNIGVAADTGRGLVVPVIRDTDRKSIVQISEDIRQLVSSAREGSIDPEQMRGGTFTITNVGPLGGTALIPAINYPEVAILGMGRVQEKPVVRDGEIVVRKILPLTLAFDHRIADGADAARFVSELVRHLSDPNLLLLET